MDQQLIAKPTGISFPKTYLSIETTSSEEREKLPKRIVYTIMLMSLTLGLSTFVFSTRMVKADGLIGDVNNDKKVDIKDYYAVAKVFGTDSNMTNWNPLCDLNGDLHVDVKDLFEVAMHFGESI